MATIHDIARISGYSIGTVSRVINNRADVSEATRKRVEEVIRQENYQPNSNARMLRQTISSEISVIVCSTSNIFLHEVLENVQIRLNEHGESANVQFVRKMGDEVRMAAQLVVQVKPRGLVFLGGSEVAFREGFSQIDVPSVLIAANAEGLGFDNLSSFTTDDVAAAGHAVRVLAERGHRRIAILGGSATDVAQGQRGAAPVTLRVRGAIEELERCGIAFDRARDFEPSALSAQEGYRAAEQLIKRTPDLTGVFAVSDAIAIGAMRAFADHGLSVPRDISVIGFDGIVHARYSVPRLATICQNTTLLAQRGVDNLLMRLTYESPAVHEKIAYQYVPGESVARPREEEGEV